MAQARWLALGLLLALLVLLPGPPQARPVVSGEVRDAAGPVRGARVRFKGNSTSALTDALGRFQLPGPFGDSTRVTAAHEGTLITGALAGQRPLSLRLTPLPAGDCERYRWVDPDPDPRQPHNCGNCHGEIHREWSLSGHARSVENPHFRNLYEGSDAHGRPGVGWGLLLDNPDGAGVCTSCHAPTVSFDDPAYYDLRLTSGTAARGVHCDYCHKVAGVRGEPGQTHGRFSLELLRPAEGQLFFGPLDDVDRGEDAYAPLYRRSRYCAACHEGTVFGVHVYGTYSEWLESPARREGKQCQTCHMAPTGTLTNLAPGNGGIPRDPATLGNHRFFAGSQEAMLRHSLHVAATCRSAGDTVAAVVEVRATDVGHCVPTGFVDRQLLVVVEAFAADGRPLPANSGPLLPPAAGKELAGRPGRLYAKLLKDFEGHSPAPFWRADPRTVDNRLVPGEPDRLELTFPAAVDHLRVRLLYRRFWQEVADAKGWSDNEVVVEDRSFGCSVSPAAR
jgi:hypothetical protein